jgi:CIC family chloride channel protein
LFDVLLAWRRSLRSVQATKLIVLPGVTGVLTGAGTIAFVELINLVQGVAIGSTELPLRLPPEQLKTLAACGAAAGIAAVFNAPIAGAFFALEVVTGSFAMPAFSPVVLSSVMATVVSRAYFGDHPAFIVQPYALENAHELVLYAGLGLFCGVVSALFVWTMDRCETAAPHVPIPRLWRPAAGGLLLGALLLVVPDVYGVGYETMDAALSGTLAWSWLALLIPTKIAATSLTLASGGSGGVFLPSLYIGSVTGGLYGAGAHALFPSSTAASGAYALVGMAGVLAAATRSPITATILLFEVSGDYKIILPVMIVATLASLVGRALKEDSLYTLKLSRRGIALHQREELIMRGHTVAEIMHAPAPVIAEHTPIAETVRYFLEHETAGVYVTNAGARFVGRISIHDIKDPVVADLGPLVVAGDVADPHVHHVAPADTLADCMDHFVMSDDDELPVVDAGARLVGVVSRRDVLAVYSSEILRHEYLGVASATAAGRPVPRSVRLTHGFTLVRMRAPAGLAGRSLRDANLRATYRLTVVAVRHGGQGEDRLPDPEATLQADDELAVVGTPADLEAFRRAALAGGGRALREGP